MSRQKRSPAETQMRAERKKKRRANRVAKRTASFLKRRLEGKPLPKDRRLKRRAVIREIQVEYKASVEAQQKAAYELALLEKADAAPLQ